MDRFSTIGRDELRSRLDRHENIQLVNVLGPAYDHLGSIPGSRRIPVDTIGSRPLTLDKDSDVVTYCAGPQCDASRRAAEMLAGLGYRVSAYEGGIQDWKDAGYALEGAGSKPQAPEASKAAESRIDEEIEASFPASDPPSWTSSAASDGYGGSEADGRPEAASAGRGILRLREIMTKDVQTIEAGESLMEAAKKMKTSDIGCLPIVKDRRLVGLLTDRDIVVRVVAEGRDPKRTRAQEASTQDVVSCFEDQAVEEGARLMGQRQVRRLVVVDRDRRPVGIVSLGDLANEAPKSPTPVAAEVLEKVSKPGPGHSNSSRNE